MSNELNITKTNTNSSQDNFECRRSEVCPLYLFGDCEECTEKGKCRTCRHDETYLCNTCKYKK